MKISNYPLLKILLPFVLGIIVGCFAHFPFRFCRIWYFLAVAFWLCSCILTLFKTYKWQWVKNLALTTGFFFAGLSAVNFRFSSHLSTKEVRLIDENQDWVVRVVDFPVLRAKTVKLVAEVTQTSAGKPIKDRVMLYVQRSPDSE